MTRLEKYLEKNCVSVSTATRTQSKYYRIGAATIRYSDHISINYSNFDIQIIKPTGSFSCLYIFGISRSPKLSLMNTKQIIAYLPYASMEAELRGHINYQKENEIKISSNKLVESKLLNNSNYSSIVYRLRTTWKKHEFNMLPAMLHEEFGISSGINTQFKDFLKSNAIQYKELINIYKILVIDNHLKPNSSNIIEAFEQVTKLMTINND